MIPAPDRVELGHTWPRIAPPRPVKGDISEFEAVAATCGISLMPWQGVAATYIEAVRPDGKWQWPEVATIVGRQNGKTELLVPHIVKRLRAGRRILHAAQNRELPREVHLRVAEIMDTQFPELEPQLRYGSGQETIRTNTGGTYKIVAATRRAARGNPSDDVIVDELREIDADFMAAVRPTLTASRNPQKLLLSNAGTEDSHALNAVRARSGEDDNLAYLEWSAAPERDAADRLGWLEANPAVGYLPDRDMMAFLEGEYQAHKYAGTLGDFETEHLCRWVPSVRERFVDEYAWSSCMGPLGDPVRPVMAVSMTPDGKRATAALAWQRPDGSIALRLIYDVTGHPINVKRLGEDMLKDATKLKVRKVAFDPVTDAELAKYFKNAERISGAVFANASAQFVNLVTAKRLRWQDGDTIGSDLAWTSRKAHDETGHFEAVRMSDDRAIPAALASIRAVWLASGPDVPSPRVY